MGSDTCGSIRIPAAVNNLFGLRVTQGLSSRDGIIPLSHTQDVGGPLARSMIDLVTVLDATVDEDPADEQTLSADRDAPDSFKDFLKADSLRGARLGVLTDYLREARPYGEVTKVVRRAIAVMEENGAEIVEIDIEGLDDLLRETSVIDMEFKRDLERYLRQSDAPVKSLSEILDSGRYHAALEERYRRSLDAGEDVEEYRDRLANRDVLSSLLLESMAEHDLDALVYPTMRVNPGFIGENQFGSLCRIAAHSGLPSISLPAGFTPDGLPVGIELMAKPFDDGRLIALGYAWEQVARPRRPPPRTPSLLNDVLSFQLELRSQQISGALRFERMTQTLHYELQFLKVKDRDVLDVKLHRGSPDETGPVVELLGRALHGAVEIRNEDVDELLEGNLQLVVYTKDAPFGALRGQIQIR
jgi:Asp-tRNA(Asn)/Glu-tRNA(Gln) amidotransferase A subunit family amidase